MLSPRGKCSVHKLKNQTKNVAKQRNTKQIEKSQKEEIIKRRVRDQTKVSGKPFLNKICTLISSRSKSQIKVMKRSAMCLQLTKICQKWEF